jgi:hypothetical protein
MQPAGWVGQALFLPVSKPAIICDYRIELNNGGFDTSRSPDAELPDHRGANEA